MIPKMAPVKIDLTVSSAIFVSADTKGLNFVSSDIAIWFCYWEDKEKKSGVRSGEYSFFACKLYDY